VAAPEPEDATGVRRLRARQEVADALERLAERGHRARRLEAQEVEPGAPRDAEVRAALRGLVEEGDVPRHLKGMAGEGVDGRRPDPDAPRVTGDLEEGEPGRLVEEVVVDGHAVEPVGLDQGGERSVGGERLVGLEGEADRPWQQETSAHASWGEAGPMPSPPEAGVSSRQPRRSGEGRQLTGRPCGLWAARAVGPPRWWRASHALVRGVPGVGTRGAKPPSEILAQPAPLVAAELVLDGIDQRLPGGVDDVGGDADRAPGLLAVPGGDEDARLGRGPLGLVEDPHLVVKERHLPEVRVELLEGLPECV